MVRFQYDHNIGQWRWHISKNAEKLDEKILDTMRNSIGSNKFTYAAVGNDSFVCMSSLQADGDSVIQGTVVGVKGNFNNMPEKPSCYIEKWGKEDLLSTDDIPAGEIPAPDKEVDYDYFPAQLGYILDAVMFGTKKVAIIVESDAEAMDCIKAINYMLPPAYAKRIGFSVGANKIPDTAISVMTDTGKSIPINVKVFFTSADKVNAASSSYYVFDIDPEDPTNNYKAELSEFAKVVEDFCLDSKLQMDMMTKHIAAAFDADGNLDSEVLKRLSLLFRFTITPDDKTAEGLIDAGIGDGTDKIQKSAFLGASRHFWRHNDPTILPEKQRQNMVAAYNSNMGTFNQSDSIEYLKYLLNQNSLTHDEKNVLVDIAVTRDCLAEDCAPLFCNPEFNVRNIVFDILTRMLFKKPNIYSCEELIKSAVEYFDINNCFAVLNNSGESEEGEELFSLAGKEKDPEVKFTLAAILMTSCFTTTASTYSPHTHIRFNGLKRMMTEEKMSPIEQLASVIKIHHKIGDIANFGDVEVNDISYFLCDGGNADVEPAWTQWIKETIFSLSITQLIDMENVLINSDYIGLKEIVEGKLLNIEYIAPELRKNEEIRSDYTRIFNMLNNDNQYKHISEYLRNLKNETFVEERFLEVRWNFLKDAYETMSDADKKKIGEMHSSASEHSVDKRNSIANRVQAEFRNANESSNRRLFNVLLPTINMVAWAIIAFIGMLLFDRTASKIIMENHSYIITNFMLLPILSAVASAFFYYYNAGRNILFRNIITAIETVIFLIIMILAFYGSIAILGLVI